MSRLAGLVGPIEFARSYTLGLLADVDPAAWFRMPGGVSHVAWQVGHLAFAQHRLVLERVCGLPVDPALVTDAFLATFGRGSTPVADLAAYPDPAAIRLAFDRVHARTLDALGSLAEADLDLDVRSPHKFVRTRGQALAWCAQHEFFHAGQIALLRRMLGASPTW